MTQLEYLDMAKTIVDSQRQLVEAERIESDVDFQAKFNILLDQFLECIQNARGGR